jgi:hypothetical protein
MFMGRVLAVALRSSPLSGSGVHLRPPSWLIKATNESGAPRHRLTLALAGLCQVELCAARPGHRAAFAADEHSPIDRLLGQIDPFMRRSNAALLTLPTFHSASGLVTSQEPAARRLTIKANAAPPVRLWEPTRPLKHEGLPTPLAPTMLGQPRENTR